MYILNYKEDEINEYYVHSIKKVMHKKREIGRFNYGNDS